MGVHTLSDEFSSPVPAPKLFKALILDADNLLPKLMPQAIKSIDAFESSPDGGTKCTSLNQMYHPKPGAQINEEEIKAGKEKGMAVYRAVEACLLANPEAYA
ncbi:hypothetical protein FH972_015484 [Carpinus fangiana]|uniref:Bet v I/Major latex protein domain-containing protein n=1 Tax=Carpinus fangiana TaxID=176857 RepID=A0A5N6RGA4_9ROSI|nr:hypothetical protein FH972_015484 [Carpinus fangiana]